MNKDQETEKQKEKEEVMFSIRGQLTQAMKHRWKVQIYASGTYKGVGGLITQISHGSITLSGETEDGVKMTTTMRISDIKRVSIYEE